MPDYRTIDKEINRFDSAGNLIQIENYAFEFYSFNQSDTIFRLVTRKDYGYNISGLVDTMLQTQVNFNGNYYFRYKYLYDASGNLIEQLRFVGNTFPLDSNLRTIYQYDSNSNLILQRDEQFILNQSFRTTTLFIWTYDSQNQNIGYRKINYQNNIPHDSLIDATSYSASGKILSKKGWRFATIVDSTYTDYVYDSNDSLIKYTDYENASGNIWIPYRTYEFSFTGDSTIEMMLSCPDTTCSDSIIRITIVRDSIGRTINNLREEYSGGGNWDFNWVETHAYNALGNIIDYHTHSNGSGCSYDEHITYDYNTSGDLVHTHSDTYHCNEYFSDCYYYNVDSDSILILIDYNDTICSNSFLPLAITLEGGIPPYQYDWTPGNYLSDSTIQNPLIMNFDTTLTYRLLVTDTHGRVAIDSIKLFGLPDLYLPINIISFGLPCENNSFHLTMDTIPLHYYFYWTFSNIYIYGDTIEAAHSGNYNLFLTDSNGCKYSYQANVNLFPRPSVSIGTDTSICLNDTLTLNAGNFVQYIWNTGDVSQAIEIHSSTPSIDTFSVDVTDANGCTNSDSISVSFEICLGQDDIYASGIKVTLLHDQIQVELPASIPSTELTLTDINGRVIINSVIHDHQSIDLSGFPAGVYVYHVENYSGIIMKE